MHQKWICHKDITFEHKNSPNRKRTLVCMCVSVWDEFIRLLLYPFCFRVLYVGWPPTCSCPCFANKNSLIYSFNLTLAYFVTDVSLALNDTIIKGGHHLYPYKAYISPCFNLMMVWELRSWKWLAINRIRTHVLPRLLAARLMNSCVPYIWIFIYLFVTHITIKAIVSVRRHTQQK
jgi:hypothetical protein